MKKAFITGITGQDGTYLTDLLLEKGYEVHGLLRRSSSSNTGRIDHVGDRVCLHYGDLTDAANLTQLVKAIEPDEIYNLGAQSHVAVSFETPEYTANVDGLGVIRLLEAIRTSGLVKRTKFYQASTSELYGKAVEVPQSEKTPFYPRSPYGVAKQYAYWIVLNYRESYNLFAVNGILFNHESPMRGETFVTRKITLAVARIKYGLQKTLNLGNLDAKRDWGHAKDYVVAQWKMLQHETPQDYVIATGEQHSVREFCEIAFQTAGMTLAWQGAGVKEVGVVAAISEDIQHVSVGDVVVAVEPQYFRPAEVDTLLGDASRARADLNWQPKTSFAALVEEMTRYDCDLVAKEKKLLQEPACVA